MSHITFPYGISGCFYFLIHFLLDCAAVHSWNHSRTIHVSKITLLVTYAIQLLIYVNMIISYQLSKTLQLNDSTSPEEWVCDGARLCFREFQWLSQLPVTGGLDTVTLEKMSSPRCGVQDAWGQRVSNIFTGQHLRKKRSAQTGEHISSVPAYVYIISRSVGSTLKLIQSTHHTSPSHVCHERGHELPWRFLLFCTVLWSPLIRFLHQIHKTISAIWRSLFRQLCFKKLAFLSIWGSKAFVNWKICSWFFFTA